MPSLHNAYFLKQFLPQYDFVSYLLSLHKSSWWNVYLNRHVYLIKWKIPINISIPNDTCIWHKEMNTFFFVFLPTLDLIFGCGAEDRGNRLWFFLLMNLSVGFQIAWWFTSWTTAKDHNMLWVSISLYTRPSKPSLSWYLPIAGRQKRWIHTFS